MQIIDLFSGLGGFSLAGRWMGWSTIQFVEIDKFCQKVLAQHFPGVPIHDDIKTLDYDKVRERINPAIRSIVVGGFPCQPFSQAGKRKGTDDNRYLWPYCIKTVREIQPDFCVFENVGGLVNWDRGLVFEQVQADLEAQGYDTAAFILPAAGVNAPHRRDRIWFVAANTASNGQLRNNSIESINDKRIREGMEEGYVSEPLHGNGTFTNTKEQRFQEWNAEQIWNGTHAAVKRYSGIPEWDNFPTQSPVCGRDDGISNRVDRIKALGNAIVPQVAYEIFKAINKAT